MRLTFAADIARRLVGSDSFGGGMPRPPIRSPLAELDFRHPRWLHPMRVLSQPAGRGWIKRSPIDFRFLQLPPQIETEFVAPPSAGTDLAREAEGAPLVVSDQYRTHAGPR